MRKPVLFLILCACVWTSTLSQSSDKKDINILPQIDVVFYDNDQIHEYPFGLYINGKLSPQSLIKTLINADSIAIEKVDVIKDATSKHKGGDIFITLRSDYQLQIISLRELKEKYIPTIDSIPYLFFIDNELIETNCYDNFVLDEKQIEQIFVKRFDNQDCNIHLNLIKIRTRSKKNENMMIR